MIVFHSTDKPLTLHPPSHRPINVLLDNLTSLTLNTNLLFIDSLKSRQVCKKLPPFKNYIIHLNSQHFHILPIGKSHKPYLLPRLSLFGGITISSISPNSLNSKNRSFDFELFPKSVMKKVVLDTPSSSFL